MRHSPIQSSTKRPPPTTSFYSVFSVRIASQFIFNLIFAGFSLNFASYAASNWNGAIYIWVFLFLFICYIFGHLTRRCLDFVHGRARTHADLPQCPNVDQFNYESMKSALIEKLERFQAAPFTVQRLCELLTDPKKHYSRLDKFMRALEKNILGKYFQYFKRWKRKIMKWNEIDPFRMQINKILLFFLRQSEETASKKTKNRN